MALFRFAMGVESLIRARNTQFMPSSVPLRISSNKRRFSEIVFP